MALRIARQRCDVPEPHGAAIARDEPVLAAPRLAREVVLVVRGERGLAVVRVQELHPDVRLVQPLLARVPEGALDLRAGVQGSPIVVGRHHVDDGRDVLDECSVALLRLAQSLLRALLRGDVVQQSLPESDLPVAVADRDRAVPDPDLSAVGSVEPVLEREGRPLLACPSPHRPYRLPIVGMGARAP